MTKIDTGIKTLSEYKMGIIEKGTACPICGNDMKITEKDIRGKKIHICFVCNRCGFKSPIYWATAGNNVDYIRPDYTTNVSDFIQSIGDNITHQSIIDKANKKCKEIEKIKNYSD